MSNIATQTKKPLTCLILSLPRSFAPSVQRQAQKSKRDAPTKHLHPPASSSLAEPPDPRRTASRTSSAASRPVSSSSSVQHKKYDPSVPQPQAPKNKRRAPATPASVPSPQAPKKKMCAQATPVRLAVSSSLAAPPSSPSSLNRTTSKSPMSPPTLQSVLSARSPGSTTPRPSKKGRVDASGFWVLASALDARMTELGYEGWAPLVLGTKVNGVVWCSLFQMLGIDAYSKHLKSGDPHMYKLKGLTVERFKDLPWVHFGPWRSVDDGGHRLPKTYFDGVMKNTSRIVSRFHPKKVQEFLRTLSAPSRSRGSITSRIRRRAQPARSAYSGSCVFSRRGRRARRTTPTSSFPSNPTRICAGP